MTKKKMEQAVFGQNYADHYDLFYQDKDYEAECNMLEGVFKRYGARRIKSILDLGCGTGNHTLPLARRGYQVTGIDRAPEMIKHAATKTVNLNKKKQKLAHLPSFHQGDILSINLHKQYDAVLMMFAVLGYQLTNDDVIAALKSARKHLTPDGLFIFDVWYGPAVLAIKPNDRVKVIPTKDGKIIRAASGCLDVLKHIAIVDYHIWQLSKAKTISETTETHQMRYFFPQELALFLSQTGFELKAFRYFDDINQEPSADTWNVLGIATAIND